MTSSPPPPPTNSGEPAAQADATLDSLRALISAAPVRLQIVHELDGPGPGALSWVTNLALPMQLQVAAAGPVAVTLDGALVFETTAPAAGALVPPEPLYVGGGELVVHVERGPAVVGFVKAIVDENPPASAFERREVVPPT